MIVQFHPACHVRSVRNEAIREYKLPMDIIAMRSMAPHDILFLDTNADMFRHFQTRCENYFQDGRIHEKFITRTYGALQIK